MKSTVLLACLLLLQAEPSPPPAQKQRPTPTLGFNNIKDVGPVMDMDAYSEEQDMQKKLPKNQFVKSKRILHETSLLNDFVEGFKNAKACNGITLYLKTDKKPDFTVQMSVWGHDDHKIEQSWPWILGYP